MPIFVKRPHRRSGRDSDEPVVLFWRAIPMEVWMDETPEPAAPDDMVGMLWMLPLAMGQATLGLSAELSQLWWRQMFHSDRRCRHEGEHQLEVPDPIEEQGERELFA